jgi:alkylation response protein AidB-like acyl-CoA dehydrogenase
MILLARTNPDAPRHRGISFLLLPMHQPGVVVEPIAQPDGTAGFNRVILTGARCPAANVVGGVDNGWKVAMTTLGFERGTSAVTSYHRFRRDVDDMIASARARGVADDPVVRQRIAAAWIVVEILGISGQRTLAELGTGRHDRDLAALESVNKLAWTEHDKRAMNLAVDLMGADAMLLWGTPDDERRASVGLGHRAVVHPYPVSPLQAGFLFSLSGSIYGGTSEVQRNLIAERTLGLPR